MATEIAKAYVQIVPSADGMEGNLKKLIDPSAKSAGDSGGKSLGGGLISGLKGILAAAGIGAIIKESLDAGGALQQSFGGLDTIYGDASAAAKDYAAQAAAAGISMNDYAEQAVAFGASLKQAFEGDTAKAAEAANTAILDMADNAAKMGTPLENIQNAYQGFAKQNYTMLDNLKLGYGGTKTEMERLLADAEKLSGVEYNIDNLGDVYSAIHVIQEDLGLTGVAAAEASTTFTGSMEAMKAAATNFLATLTTGGDVTGSLEVLGNTVLTFVQGNLLPMIGNLVGAIPGILQTASQMLVEIVPDMITNLTNGVVTNLPMLIDTATQLITGLISGIIEVAPLLIDAAIQIIQSLSDYVMQNLEPLLESGMTILLELCTGILQNIPTIIETVTTVINTFLEYILSHLPEVLAMGVNILMQISQGILNSLPEIVTAVAQMILTFIQTVIEHLPEILQNGIELIAQLVVGIIQAIPQVVEGIGQVVTNIIDTLKGKWEDFKSAGVNIIEGLKEGIVSAAHKVIDAVRDVAERAWNAVTDFFDIESPSKLMRESVGKNIALGWAEGLDRYGDYAVNAASDVSHSVFDALKNPIDAKSSLAMERSATINLSVVGEINGEPLLRFVNNGIGAIL